MTTFQQMNFVINNSNSAFSHSGGMLSSATTSHISAGSSQSKKMKRRGTPAPKSIDRLLANPSTREKENYAIRQAISRFPLLELDVHTVLADNTLPAGMKRSDIQVTSSVHLEREKDQGDDMRYALATQVAKNIEEKLKVTFTGRPKEAKYNLSVAVTVATKGSKGRILGADLGFAHAKLAVTYCLTEAVIAPEIIKAGRFRSTDSLEEGWEDLVALITRKDSGMNALLGRMTDHAAECITEKIDLRTSARRNGATHSLV